MTPANTMLAIKGTWANKETFKLIPVSNDCPYVEGFFDIDSQILVLLGKVKKSGYHMVEKIDDNGDPILKKRIVDPKDSKYKMERRLLESFTEYYIETQSCISEFLELMLVNKSFDYKKYIKSLPLAEMQKPQIVADSDDQGAMIKSIDQVKKENKNTKRVKEKPTV